MVLEVVARKPWKHMCGPWTVQEPMRERIGCQAEQEAQDDGQRAAACPGEHEERRGHQADQEPVPPAHAQLVRMAMVAMALGMAIRVRAPAFIMHDEAVQVVFEVGPCEPADAQQEQMVRMRHLPEDPCDDDER